MVAVGSGSSGGGGGGRSTENTIHDSSGFPKRRIPQSRAAPWCLTDKVRGSSPLIQRHFGGAFQDDFLGGGCAHCGRLFAAQTCKEMRPNTTANEFNTFKGTRETNQ